MSPKKSLLYQERYRPRFHFTADQGWINDPNGLVYVNGVHHLFFQHDRQVWGHAVSTDLLHWKQLPDAIPKEDGHPAFSGSAVIDRDNTTGFQSREDPPVVAAYTSWGEGQYLAYSNDNGITWKRYLGNPVLKLPGDELQSFPLSARDSHVMWDEENNCWVMVLYSNPDQRKDKKGAGFSIFTSRDLKQWTKQSHLAGFYVCPDVFQLPIEGQAGQRTWIAMDWAQYATGDFDGKTFIPSSKIRKLDFGKNLSANQSWKHLPDGWVIQICWLRGGKYPGMSFDQQLSFPTELSLYCIGDKILLCKNPIEEIRTLHRNDQTRGPWNWKKANPLKSAISVKAWISRRPSPWKMMEKLRSKCWGKSSASPKIGCRAKKEQGSSARKTSPSRYPDTGRYYIN